MLEAWISPEYGCNLCSLSVGGFNVIDYKPDVLKAGGYTGTPVLYPTPNRVRDGVFRFNEKNYVQSVRGKRVFEHGLVHGEAWNCGLPEVSEDSASLRAWLGWEEGSPLFEAFPFRHRLELRFVLRADGLEVTYSIENKDKCDIPYGFGLHPYFMKLSGEDGTRLTVPAKYVMEATPDLLPTGGLIPVEGTDFDLSRPTKIGGLDLDHVFTGILPGQFASIDYGTPGMGVTLRATGDFTHVVVYSPKGEGFFCVENQTCSTDAHNLYDRGYAGESGLKLVPPGETQGGSVQYAIEWR